MGQMDIHMGDIVRLRKPHPCGGYEWRVMRVGADIGLKCQTCGRVVMLPRGEFERRLKAIVSRWPDNKPASL
ncbi:MAG: DUF951 domain-containing protein [Anaerolineae bacterium]|nr:DUF951 domain-containing protein [Anaerolineae bacterium]